MGMEDGLFIGCSFALLTGSVLFVTLSLFGVGLQAAACQWFVECGRAAPINW
jgi:hypothetical protein